MVGDFEELWMALGKSGDNCIEIIGEHGNAVAFFNSFIFELSRISLNVYQALQVVSKC